MFTFRLWRRIHRPFLFLLFAWTSLLLLTKASIVSTVVPPSDAANDLPSFIEAKIMHKSRNQERSYGDDINIDETVEEFVAIPPIEQLPFCGDKKIRVDRSSSENTFTQHFPVQNESDFSDEVILTKPGRQLIVATLDGRVSLLDSSGKILWSVCTGHLFSSTISSLQLSERGKYIKLIPSLTGGLYKYDGISLEAMPMNADSLLKRSFKLAQDVVITGGKEFRTFGIDLDSGMVKYECGISGCKSPTTADPQLTSDEDSARVVLVIKKTLQTVRAIDSITGSERWNFSVGTHELALAGVTDGCYEGATGNLNTDRGHIPNQFRMIIPEGLVFSTDEQKHVVWRHKFDTPISQAWVLQDTNLQILDPIKSHGVLDNPPSLYVGIHRQQFYVQESQATQNKLYMALEENNRSDLTTEPLQISWKPTPTYVASPTPSTIPEEIAESDNTAVARLYPEPFFVYESDAVAFPSNQAAIEASPPRNPLTIEEMMDDIEEVNVHGEDSVDATVIMAMATLWFWWKEILGISLLTAVILNVILLRPVVYMTRRRTIAEVINQVNLFLRRNREQQQHQLALPPPPPETEFISTSSDTLEASSSPTPNNNNKMRLRTTSTSSGASNQSDEQLVPFVSQYLKEFDPVQCLGKGAFGTVFEAKKKIDDRTYAVKRISLPNREKSRDRVMREVKALARLDHKNIVRYFNAWIESPPSGWLEKNDPLWNAFTLNSPSPTCDTNDASSFTRDRSSLPNISSFVSKKRGHSEIAILETPDEDSFIVFEQENSREVLSNGNSSSRLLIQEESETSDWSSEIKNRLTSSTSDESVEVSKFYRRPTTLDIPSSSDSDWNSDSETGGSTPGSSVMYLYIQQELCQKRTLQDWLRGESTRRLKEVMGMFLELVEAVEYIHSNNLIHRDLKPGNIFLAGSPSEGQTLTVKIGDFGLATTLAGKTRDGPCAKHDLETGVKCKVKLTGQVGTQLYMAPEQAQGKAYDHKVDIFSLGLIFFELLVPLSTEMEKHTELHKLRQMKFSPHFVKSFPDQFELIQDMVSHDPNSRPDASEIKVYLSKSSNIHGNAFRSRSYPEHLMNPSLGSGRRAHDKDRILYKTHSAM